MRANFDYCATLVRDADRDRYLATLFAPAEHRDGLFALYAFNAEIGRVRDAAREPMPGEIRLQWWREALSGGRDSEAEANPVAGALRETLGRYGLSVAPLLTLVDERTFDLYHDPMATVTDLEIYGIKTQSALFSMAATILGAGGVAAEPLTLDAGIVYTIAGVLGGLARHASRRQLFVPLDVLRRHGVERDEIFAGQGGEPLRAALAEMRAIARRHMVVAQAKMAIAPAAILPALLPVATVGAQLRRMDRADYDPFQFQPAPAWRRQWQLWRAARDPRRIFRA